MAWIACRSAADGRHAARYLPDSLFVRPGRNRAVFDGRVARDLGRVSSRVAATRPHSRKSAVLLWAGDSDRDDLHLGRRHDYDGLLLPGGHLTSWPGVRDDLVNAGATWLDQPFVRDGNLATSRGPQDLIPFVQGCLDLFAQDGPISRTTQPAVPRSAPQANEPPEVVLSAMKWLPKPSFRTAVGALAAVVVATRPRRGNGEASPVRTLRGQM
jgi:hypothetical protein